MEDSLWLDAEHTQPATNLELVRRIHALAEANGRALMAPPELRALVGLPVR
jgi:3-keto-5-aminohexanoate cleavage enzyme